MSFEDLAFSRSMTIRGDQTKQDCSRALAGDVFRIKTALAAFQRLVYNLGTPKDTPHLRHKLHISVLQIGQLLEDASAKLKQSTQTHPHAPDAASKKIFDEKLAKEIAYIHREFQKAQRLAAERESAYAPLTPHQIVSYSDSPSEPDMMKSMRSKEHTSLMIGTRSQDVINVESETVLNEAIIEERDQGIKEIQQQIGEVNEIFKDLAVLVREQGAMIDDIDTNIEGSRDAIDQGTSQLTKASKIQRSNSSTKCLVVVIFGIILLIVVVVVAA